MITESHKNIIKGIAIATIIFGAGYFIASSRGKKAKTGKDAEDKKIVDASPEIEIEVVNPDVMDEEVAKDVFAHADGENAKAKEVKILEPTSPISDEAEDAIRWFHTNKYSIKRFANDAFDNDEIVELASKARMAQNTSVN